MGKKARIARQRIAGYRPPIGEVPPSEPKPPPKPITEYPELFVIPRETIDACSEEEAAATYKDLDEMGLAKLPYPSLDIMVYPPSDRVKEWDRDRAMNGRGCSSNWQLRFLISIRDECLADMKLGTALSNMVSESLLLDEPNKDSMERILAEHRTREDFVAARRHFAGNIIRLLIVLLATRNVVKERRENKLLKLGIGKGKPRPRYTTTLRVPQTAHLVEDSEHSHTGQKKRPHLRHGHIRHQRYGHQLQYSKQVWIDPAFINADEDFVETRTAYRLTPY